MMQIATLPLSSIVPGINPRTFFDPEEMQELVESIRANGLMQPIVVRPRQDGYQIIAGERRWRAMQAIQASEIAAVVKDVTDEEAEVLALVENVNRADMSPTEEAVAANKLLMRLRDRAEVAVHLGWPISKLDKRLALMQCVPAVREALDQRKIKLGHAELLAVLPADKQEVGLQMVMERDMSVADVKRSFAALSQKLAEAIFDQADCLSCQHNSGLQSALFAENIGDGACTNSACFHTKTNEHLERIRTQLAREVNRVEFLEHGEDKIIPIKLVQEGSKGIGYAQMSACKGCASFGATVSKLPGKLGTVEKSICFDASCHADKVSAYQKYLLDVQQQASKAATAPGTASVVTKGASASSGSKTAVAAPAPSVKPGEFRSSIKEYADKQLRKIAAGAIGRNPEKGAEILLWLITTGAGSHIPGTSKVLDAVSKVTGTKLNARPTLADAGAALTQQPDMVTRGLAATAGYTLMESAISLTLVKQVITYLNVDLKTQWKISTEFLDLLTKAELEAFATQHGLKEAIGEEAYKKVFNNKKDDVIKGLMAFADTHFAGKLHDALCC